MALGLVGFRVQSLGFRASARWVSRRNTRRVTLRDTVRLRLGFLEGSVFRATAIFAARLASRDAPGVTLRVPRRVSVNDIWSCQILKVWSLGFRGSHQGSYMEYQLGCYKVFSFKHVPGQLLLHGFL